MKYTKDQAGYEPKSSGMDDCDDCMAFTAPNKCAKVEGAVSPEGWCKLFIEAKNSNTKCEGCTVLQTKQYREHDKVKSRLTGEEHEIEFGPMHGNLVPANPFASKAQAGFLHAHPEKVGGEAALKEWDSSTDFSHLPKKKAKK